MTKSKRTLEERILEEERKAAEAMEKAKQYTARRKQLEKQKSEMDRKRRTKRLIELGGIVESVLGRETEEADKEKLLNFLKMQERNGLYFSKAMNAVEERD